jgi:hypothetical protein
LPGELAQFGERLVAACDPLGGLRDRGDCVGFGDFARFAFEHDEAIGADTDRELEVGLFALRAAGERDPLAVRRAGCAGRRRGPWPARG